MGQTFASRTSCCQAQTELTCSKDRRIRKSACLQEKAVTLEGEPLVAVQADAYWRDEEAYS
jgi:hypothetical protein